MPAVELSQHWVDEFTELEADTATVALNIVISIQM